MISSNGETDSHVVFSHQFQASADTDTETARREALGQAAWLEAFWLPTQQRKHPNFVLRIEKTEFSVLVKHNDNQSASHADGTSADTTPIDWNKLLQSSLKKIQVEDLGELAAQDLFDTIPVEDREGRGRKDLEKLEKQLSVKVVFLEDNHILLVGAKAKLEKKCLVVRNVLSHYYWRLKGKQINL